MKCILCDKSSKKILNSSFLKLPVYFCGDCNIYMNGDSLRQKTEKVSDMYKKDFWDKNNAEVEINSDHTDKNSEGKKRDLISQIRILKNSFPYYPRIKTDENNGKYLRIILKNS